VSDIERRYLTERVELRASDSGPGVLRGYAAKFGKLSQNLGGFVEQVDPRAFNKSIADGLDVLARYNHNDNMLLGRTSSGTVTLTVDSVGLRYDVSLPDTTVGRDLAVLAKRGDVSQSSFAFVVPQGGDSWGESDQGMPLRTLESVILRDVAPVNSPAYLDTSVGLRSLAAFAGVEFEEVRSAAETGDLRQFLVPIDPEKRAALVAQRDANADTSILTQAMAWFTAVDSIVDEAQEALAAHLGIPSPDPDDTDTGAGENALNDDVEQRATHSTPPSVLLLIQQLNDK
jgi:HK97 family phage prohead protease